MQQRNRTVCRYFDSPRGCRNDPCRFIHGSRSGTHGSSGRSSALQLTAPLGTCPFFYNFGSCKFGQCCRYTHAEPGQDTRQWRVGAHPRMVEHETTHPTSSGSDISAIDALRRLSVFCDARTPFTRPFQMVQFVKLLNAADPKNETWDSKDAQKCLEIVTEIQGKGAKNIADILEYDGVVTRVQSNDEISFATYLGCVSYMVSDFVLDSTLTQRVNLLFGILHTHYERFEETVTRCMDDMIALRSFDDLRHGAASGVTIFNALTLVLIEYLVRIKAATYEHSTLPILVESIEEWFYAWKSTTFVDGWKPENDHVRNFTIDRLQRQVKRLSSIIGREEAYLFRQRGASFTDSGLGLSPGVHQAALAGSLELQYEPAGHLRTFGPRHNNDFEDIQRIQIPPTEDEMLCTISPFLPANIPDAPHHLPSESMERLIDIQFRLLREELLAPLRTAIQSIVQDLLHPSGKTLLQPIIETRGGRYIAQSGMDSVMVNLYTTVNPIRVVTDKRGICIELKVDAPPGAARVKSAVKRVEYWKAVARKRLMQGGLVCVLWRSNYGIQLFFGLISSSADDLQASIQEDTQEAIRLRVKFFDSGINLRVVEWCNLAQSDRESHDILLIEAPVMYESIRPLLQALQREPTSFPFSQYLVHYRENGLNDSIQVPPPRYTLSRPDFTWDLSCLFHGDLIPLQLNPADPNSIGQSRHVLKTSSRLDSSQADAMVDCLTREFCLIQGPPGTGKSFTGVEIMRVLLANKVGRILLIAFTNHALDHLLRSVLEAGITNKIVRLGSRSNDDKIAKFSLGAIERERSDDFTSVNNAYYARKDAERDLKRVLDELQNGRISEGRIDEYMEFRHPEHREELLRPPQWVERLRYMNVGWIDPRSRKPQQPKSHYEFWTSCNDIHWLETQYEERVTRQESHNNPFSLLSVEDLGDDGDGENAASTAKLGIEKEDEERSRKEFLLRVGLAELPPLPVSNRPLDEVQEDPTVWHMSRIERACLHQSWVEEARKFFEESKEAFADLKEDFEEARIAHEECQSQMRLGILENAEIIGCTTTGAAKLATLLNGIHPSVLLVEEAGQVLEAHVVGSLVQSLEHVIMIGDPLQLRPNISNYALSMDHPIGGKIYRFDQSTMERLENAGMSMSRLSVQRRMRPEISSIARNTLYNYLEDHERVMLYPNVKGVARNLFFFHHAHAEGGVNEESTSKFNNFEVSMIQGLVQHLLRQGSYKKSGSIAILCMYLGQLVKIRDALQDIKINLALDARDEEDLRAREGDTVIRQRATLSMAEAKITNQVLLRTVDNFQGEEADIVLLSLVRNHGEGNTGSIGFLKSPNRANVALTRARHGLYVFGNGDLLAQGSEMWSRILRQFKDKDAYGSTLPIVCNRHPNDIQWVKDAASLRQASPEGGCLRPCDYRLKCGHMCPLKCHSGDEGHLFIKCHEPCRRTCSYGHPCPKKCWVECGKCAFNIGALTLDCCHIFDDALCYQQYDRSSVRCQVLVEKKSSKCEHQIWLPCFQDPAEVLCPATCGELMHCCQRICGSQCGECKLASSTNGGQRQHKDHRCPQFLQCRHRCPELCQEVHGVTCGTADCREPCRQSCVHGSCPLYCSEPCIPCVMACPWKCEHHECSAPCGSPCVRLPCDLRCTNSLPCGHPCPSVCGEPCEQQLCPECAKGKYFDTVVDLFRYRKLSELDTSSRHPYDMTITLHCHHTFTIETLDVQCSLKGAYEWDDVSNSWRCPLLPSRNFVELPGCPSCGEFIDARRYGRITKHGNLDVLESNVATQMARELGSIQMAYNHIVTAGVDKAIEIKVTSRPDLPIPASRSEAADSERERLMSHKVPSSILSAVFLGSRIGDICGITQTDGDVWTKSISPLLELYQRSSELASKKTTHSMVCDTSLSMVYVDECCRRWQGLYCPGHAENLALQAAKLKADMTQQIHPRAVTRFQVEAIWMSIEIRLLIGDLAERYLRALSKKLGATPTLLKAWFTSVVFIYDSCIHDVKLAAKIARRTSSYRQELRSGLCQIRSRCRKWQFLAIVKTSQRGGSGLDEEDPFAKMTRERLSGARHGLQELRSRCISKGNIPSTVVRDEFDSPVERRFKHLEELLVTLEHPTAGYQGPTDEGHHQVVKSLAHYQYPGRWCSCVNGHIFTISEVGGELASNKCAECGAGLS